MPYGRTVYGRGKYGVGNLADHSVSATGTLTTSGSAAALRQLRATATGTLTTSGSAVGIQHRRVSATGLLTTSGAAAAIRQLRATAMGLLTTSGSANGSRAFPVSAVGMFTTSGRAAVSIIYHWVPPVFEGELIPPTETEVFVVHRDGERIRQLTPSSVDYVKWELNGPGEAAFTVDPLSYGADQIFLLEREIQIWMDGELVWWGVPWRRGGPHNAMQVLCQGLMSYFTKRAVTNASLLYTSIDQLSIAWDLLRWAQDNTVQANRDLNIGAAAFGPSGRVRSRNYLRENHEFIFDLLQEFPTLFDGFDFAIEVTPTSRLWTPYYPKKGTFKPEFTLEFDEEGARGINQFTYNEDAVPVVTDGYATGGTSGSVKFEGHYEDVASSARFGVMHGIISEGSQKDVVWLEERAHQWVEERKAPIIMPDIKTANVPISMRGKLVEGDSTIIRIDYGAYQVPSVEHRIQSIQWNPDDTLDLAFQGLAA